MPVSAFVAHVLLATYDPDKLSPAAPTGNIHRRCAGNDEGFVAVRTASRAQLYSRVFLAFMDYRSFDSNGENGSLKVRRDSPFLDRT